MVEDVVVVVVITSEDALDGCVPLDVIRRGEVGCNLTVSGEVRVAWLTVTVLTPSEDSDNLQQTSDIKEAGKIF